MSETPEIPFESLIDALLDEETPFNPRYLYRLSDLDTEDLNQFLETWPRLPLWRRQALLEDLEELGSADLLLSFESIGRNVVADENPFVRRLAVQILWEFDSFDLIPIFLQLLQSDPDPGVRAAAASGLGQFVYLGELDHLPREKSSELEDCLLETIRKDRSDLVRSRALESFSYSGRPEVSELIETAFGSNDHELMASALLAMGRSMDSRWEKTVKSMLNSKIPALRAEAARAAGELQSKEAISTLVELCEDSEEVVRSAAIWSLSEIGGEQANATLERLFREADNDQDADFLETALDNLAFTDGLQPFSLFDIPEDSPEDELYEMLIAQEIEEKGGFQAKDFLDNAQDEEDNKDFQD
jgi:HEAT repeat protein